MTYITPSRCTAACILRCDGGSPLVSFFSHRTRRGSERSAAYVAVDAYVALPPVWSHTLPPQTHITSSSSITAECLFLRTGRSPVTRG